MCWKWTRSCRCLGGEGIDQEQVHNRNVVIQVFRIFRDGICEVKNFEKHCSGLSVEAGQLKGLERPENPFNMFHLPFIDQIQKYINNQQKAL